MRTLDLYFSCFLAIIVALTSTSPESSVRALVAELFGSLGPRAAALDAVSGHLD